MVSRDTLYPDVQTARAELVRGMERPRGSGRGDSVVLPGPRTRRDLLSERGLGRQVLAVYVTAESRPRGRSCTGRAGELGEFAGDFGVQSHDLRRLQLSGDTEKGRTEGGGVGGVGLTRQEWGRLMSAYYQSVPVIVPAGIHRRTRGVGEGSSAGRLERWQQLYNALSAPCQRDAPSPDDIASDQNEKMSGGTRGGRKSTLRPPF